MENRPQCIICGGKMGHITDDLYRCHLDGMIQSSLPADPKIYDRAYHEKYVRYEATKLGRNVNLARWEMVVKNITKPCGFLDYGCGCGQFTAMNPDPGWFDCKGYDLNPHSAFNAIPGGKFQSVSFWDSLEHMDDPRLPIKAINPEWIFITTPDCSTVKDMTSWRHYRPHEHVHYFTPVSLIKFFFSLGYQPMEMNRVESALRNPDNPEWLMSMAARRR